MNAPAPATVALTVGVRGIGFLAPGLADWAAAAAALRGEVAYLPAKTVLPPPQLLPPAERRRAVPIVKLALAAGQQACEASGLAMAELASVFSSSDGDGGNCHHLCETLASDDRMISPTRFHNSVHNAAAGYWSIAAGATPTSNAMCGADGSFAAGLLEAVVQVVAEERPVLLVAYETDFPEPLFAKRPIPDCGGVALVLVPADDPRAEARLCLTLGHAAPDTLSVPALDPLRAAIPAMRALPLLEALAGKVNRRVTLDYLADLQLLIDVGTASGPARRSERGTAAPSVTISHGDGG